MKTKRSAVLSNDGCKRQPSYTYIFQFKPNEEYYVIADRIDDVRRVRDLAEANL